MDQRTFKCSSNVRDDRRTFLKAAGALAGASMVTAAAGASSQREVSSTRRAKPGERRSGKAKNVIFFVADGMSMGTLSLGELYSKRHLNRRMRWTDWIASGNAHLGLTSTEAADSLVTDSAASASCWSIGERVNNGAICHTPDGREPTPLGVLVKRSGRRVGLVTTTSLPDATIAVWLANAENRRSMEKIAAQMLDRGVDIALGGGGGFFSAALRSRSDGIAIVRDRATLLASANGQGRLLGLFSERAMPFTLDRAPTTPSLVDMTRLAIDRLSHDSQGFLLVVEGARVDHAAHANDAGALVREMVEFDEALGLALDFAQRRDDTLIVATTDHANANPGLTVYGKESYSRFDRLADVKHSLEWLSQRLGELPASDKSASSVAKLLLEATGVEVTRADLEMLGRWRQGERVDPFIERNKRTSPIGSLLGNYLGVGFISPNHASDRVLATASGPGAELLKPAGHHTDVHAMLTEAMRLAPAGAR